MSRLAGYVHLPESDSPRGNEIAQSPELNGLYYEIERTYQPTPELVPETGLTIETGYVDLQKTNLLQDYERAYNPITRDLPEILKTLFPIEDINNSMGISIAEFARSWNITKPEQIEYISQAFSQAVTEQIKQSFVANPSGPSGEPMGRGLIGIDILENKTDEYRDWVSVSPRLNSNNAWLQYMRSKYKNVPVNELQGNISVVKDRVKEIYRMTTSDKKTSDDLALIISKIEGKEVTVSNYDKQVLQDIEMLARLSNITWFASQFLRSYVEKTPDRLTKENFTSFNNMVKIKLKQSETVAHEELGKDLWQPLVAWEMTDGLIPPSYWTPNSK